jgi:uncharacterized protein DUF2147
MWNVRSILFAIALAAGLAAGTCAAAEPSAAGLWQKSDEGKPVIWVLMIDHDGVFEGIMARLFPRPGDDPNPICKKCIDDRKNAPTLGLSFIRGMKRNGLKYEDGTILDPRDGKVYSAMMSVSPDGKTLIMRGYIGLPLLGRNQYWSRLPDTAYRELDPSVNPNAAAGPKKNGRKSDGKAKSENSAKQ